YTPLAVADGLQLCSPVTLHFVPVHGLVDAKHKLLQGAIDVAMWLVDTHVLARSDGISTKVILKLDESLEADKLFARSGITHFSQLIGRRVAYQKEEASYFMLYSLCQQHGMDIGQIHLEPTTAEEAARRFAENDFDAA